MITKIAAVILTGLTATAPAQGQDHAKHQPKTLKLIMADLGKSVNKLNDAIFVEDWQAISQAAKQVADHPHVLPVEMKAISTTLGKDMEHFKHWDHLVHETSLKLSKAADVKDMKTVLTHLATVMSGCVSCHSEFRPKVQKALSGEK
jgi:cytochrome c556